MSRPLQLASLSACSVLLAACSILTPPAQIKQLKEPGAYWLNYDADRRGAIVRTGPDTTPVLVCAEPAPDTSSNFNFQSALKTGSLSNVSAQGGQTVVILPGRTSTVLSLREALYRLCELSINRKEIPAADILNSYNKVIAAITQHAEADAAHSNANTEAMLKSLTAASEHNSAFAAVGEAERNGFVSIAQGNFSTALTQFSSAVNLYPGYHNVLEIKQALSHIVPASGSVKDADKQALLNNIVYKWSWGVPVDVLAQIKGQIK